MNVTPRRSKRSISLVDTPEKVSKSVYKAEQTKPVPNTSHAQRVVNIVSWESSDATPLPEEAILRDFDLNLKFGPCCTLSRKERWVRATNLGLCPPVDIVSLIEKTKNDESVLDFHTRQISC